MISPNEVDRILNLYEQYKEQYGKDNMIDIIPCEDGDSDYLAYTNNEELSECIINKTAVTLFVNPKFLSYSDEYIQAVMYHEFTHISDAYNFIHISNSNILMSTYSEFNAMRVEIMEKCNSKVIGLDDVICGEGENTTPRKEIEDNLETIIMISQIPRLDSKRAEEREGYLFNMLIKSYAYLFAYLSFFENTNYDYVEKCFEKLNQYNQKELAKKMYRDIFDIGHILENPTELMFDVLDIRNAVFE